MTTPGSGAGGENRQNDGSFDAGGYDDPGYDGRDYENPGYVDPTYVDPGRPGQADPGQGYADQGYADQGYADPAQPNPGYDDLGQPNPGYADPGYAGGGTRHYPGASQHPEAGYPAPPPGDPSGTYEQRRSRQSGASQPDPAYGRQPPAGEPQDVGVHDLLANSEPHGRASRRPRRGWRAGADPRRAGTPTEPRPAPGAEPGGGATRPVPGPDEPPPGSGSFGRVGQGVGQGVGWMRERAAGGMTALRARRAETPAHSRRRSAGLDPAALRALPLAVGMFTVIPLPPSRTAQDATEPGLGGWALRWLPLLGALLGFVAWALSLVFWRGHAGGSAFLGAVVWVGVLALLSRGLHLDGLADVADGLGSRRPAAEALAIMRRSDVGPFGVAAAVGAVLLQVAAATTLLAGATRAQGLVLLVVATVAGRLAALDAARPTVPSARPAGFGAVVAGTASTAVSAVAVVATLVAGWLLLALTATSLVAALWLPFAVLVGLAAGRLVSWHVVRRLDGITGDVFGAVIEVTTTVTLLALAAVVAWNGLL